MVRDLPEPAGCRSRSTRDCPDLPGERTTPHVSRRLAHSPGLWARPQPTGPEHPPRNCGRRRRAGARAAHADHWVVGRWPHDGDLVPPCGRPPDCPLEAQVVRTSQSLGGLGAGRSCQFDRDPDTSGIRALNSTTACRSRSGGKQRDRQNGVEAGADTSSDRQALRPNIPLGSDPRSRAVLGGPPTSARETIDASRLATIAASR
jgi:hypothetical protein